MWNMFSSFLSQSLFGYRHKVEYWILEHWILKKDYLELLPNYNTLYSFYGIRKLSYHKLKISLYVDMIILYQKLFKELTTFLS